MSTLHPTRNTPTRLELCQARLAVAAHLATFGIQCLVVGADAVTFAYQSGSKSLTNLELIVSSEQIDVAVQAIVDWNPVYQKTGTPHETWRPYYYEKAPLDKCSFPESIWLRDTSVSEEEWRLTKLIPRMRPVNIFLHPHSFYNAFGVLDLFAPESTITLPQLPASVRFPSQTSFLDILLACYMEPPFGYFDQRFADGVKSDLDAMLARIAGSDVFVQGKKKGRKPKPVFDGVIEAVRPEHRRLLNKWVSEIEVATTETWTAEYKARRRMMQQLGLKQAELPFPAEDLLQPPSLEPHVVAI